MANVVGILYIVLFVVNFCKVEGFGFGQTDVKLDIIRTVPKSRKYMYQEDGGTCPRNLNESWGKQDGHQWNNATVPNDRIVFNSMLNVSSTVINNTMVGEYPHGLGIWDTEGHVCREKSKKFVVQTTTTFKPTPSGRLLPRHWYIENSMKREPLFRSTIRSMSFSETLNSSKTQDTGYDKYMYIGLYGKWLSLPVYDIFSMNNKTTGTIVCSIVEQGLDIINLSYKGLAYSVSYNTTLATLTTTTSHEYDETSTGKIKLKVVYIILILFLVTLTCTCVTLYRKRWNILYFNHKIWSDRISTVPDTYVVYVSTSDESFCDTYVVPYLQKYLVRFFHGTNDYLICRPDSNFRLGYYRNEEAYRCIENSSVFVAVITKEYCTNADSQFEFDVAMQMNKPMFLMFKESVDDTPLSSSMSLAFSMYRSARWKSKGDKFQLVDSWERICSAIKDIHTRTRDNNSCCSFKNINILCSKFNALFCCTSYAASNDHMGLLQNERDFAAYLSFSDNNFDDIYPHVYNKLIEKIKTRGNEHMKPICTREYFRLGRRITDEQSHCIARSANVIFVVSKEFCQSKCCLTEIGFAIAMRKPIMLLFIEPIQKRKLPKQLRTFRNKKIVKLYTKRGDLKAQTLVWETVRKEICRNVANGSPTYV